VLVFAAQFHTRYFSLWWFDAHTNRLVEVIAADRRGREAEPFSVAASRFYAETVKYYRKRLRLRQMSEEVVTEDLEKADAEYFVLTPAERGLIDKLKLRVLVEDEFGGGIVARRS
jgi:hypothetical protein